VNVLVPGSYTITFDHTDTNGNEADQVTRTVNVVDTTIPVITIHGDSNITHEAGDVYTDAGAVWNDIVDGEGNVSGVGEVNVLVPGSYTITFDHTDTNGNEADQVTRTVNVVDTTIPLITLNGDANITHEGGSAYTDAGAVWNDIVDGEGNVSGVGEVDVMVPGIYVIYYNFTDSSGNAAVQFTRSIEVVDTTIPIIELLGEENMSIYVWTDFIDPWVEAYDAVDGNLSAQVEVIDEIINDLPGEYSLTYVLTDSSGNRAQAVTRKVIVENRAPVGITLDINQTEENQPAGTYVGQLITTDPDDPQGERFYSYQLLEDDENTSSALFSVDSTGQVFTEESLDYETESYHTIRVRTRDQFGGEYEQEIGIEVLDTTIPIVYTELPVFESGSLRLGGKIGHRGGLEPVIRSGVVVSGEPIRPGMLGTDRVQEFDILLERNASEYSALIGLEKITARDAGNLYVMAYAENTEGRAYGLEERINITPRALEQDDWTGARALENREGWWNSPWFGTYYRSEESGWLLHLGLGWMYPAPGTTQGLWLWKENLNWLWTDEEVYPFLYSSDTGTWLYFYGELNRKRLLYDYGLQKWMTLDEREVDEEEGAR
jgi:hypothetical protein